MNNASAAASAGGASTSSPGKPVVFQWTEPPSIGLNFYDGRFLRAADLNLEHRSLRAYSDLGNRAGGYGVVHGLEFSVSGDSFTLDAGLAVDGTGQLIYLPAPQTRTLAALLATAAPKAQVAAAPKAQDAAAPAGFEPCEPGTSATTEPITVTGSALYVVSVARMPLQYGQEDVLGRLCDAGCATPSSSPYVVDGVALSLVPLGDLPLPDPGDGDPAAFLRSRVASGWFARERGGTGDTASLLSGAGLRRTAWGRGALAPESLGVPLAVLGWSGSAVTLLDSWTVRRERLEPPAASYWSGRLERRPWPVFLAQVLQFQSQLADSGIDPLGGPGSPGAGTSAGAPTAPRSLPEVFVELPSAGYLPVTATSGLGLRHELEGWFGSGVDLRVCAVGRDQVAGELDGAQHLDRISLVPKGDPARREPVDVLVPDGSLETTPAGNLGFALGLALGTSSRTPESGGPLAAAADPNMLALDGVARVGATDGWTMRAAAAGTGPKSLLAAVTRLVELAQGGGDLGTSVKAFSAAPDFGEEPPSLALLREDAARAERRVVGRRADLQDTGAAASSRSLGVSASLWLARNPFSLADGESAAFHAEWDAALGSGTRAVSMVADGWAQRTTVQVGANGPEIGFALVGAMRTTGGTSADLKTTNQNLGVTVWARRVSTAGQESVIVRDDASTWRVRLDWSGQPVRASGTLAATKPGEDDVDAIQLLAVEDIAIDRTGDAHRDAALAGLQIVSELHPSDTRFVERGFAELFPGGTGLDTVVAPVTDWVLFRRRTWRTCESEVATTPVGTSTVAAWVVRAHGLDEARSWAEGLRAAAQPDIPWPAKPVLVQFETGTALMRSGANAWRTDLQAARAGALVQFAGYAPAVQSTEGPPGAGRAQAVVEAGAPVIALAQGGVVDLLADPPAVLMLPGTQGSIFLITYDILEPLDVVAVDVGKLKEGELDAIRQGNVSQVATAGEAFTTVSAVDDVDDIDRGDPSVATAVAGYVESHPHDKEEWVVWVRDDLPEIRTRRVMAGVEAARSRLNVPASVQNQLVQPDGTVSLPSVRFYLLLSQGA
jgi:hypothetical protein